MCFGALHGLICVLVLTCSMDIFVALFYGFYIKEVFRTKEHMTYMRTKFLNADMMVYRVKNYIYFHQNSLGILFTLFFSVLNA